MFSPGPDWDKCDAYWRRADALNRPGRLIGFRSRLEHRGADDVVERLFKRLSPSTLRQVFAETSFADLVAERVRGRLRSRT